MIAEVSAKTRNKNSSSMEEVAVDQIEIVEEIVEKDEKAIKTTTTTPQTPTTTTRLLFNDSVSNLKDVSADSNRTEIGDKPPAEPEDADSSFWVDYIEELPN